MFFTTKNVRIRNYSGPYFPAFGLNTERYRLSLRIQCKCEKIRTRVTSNTDTQCLIFTPFEITKSGIKVRNPNFNKKLLAKLVVMRV